MLLWNWDANTESSDRVRAAPDFLVPAKVVATGTQFAQLSPHELIPTNRSLTASLEYQHSLGRYGISSFTLSVPEGDEITGELLREMKPAKDLQDILDGYVSITLTDGTPFDLTNISKVREEIVSQGPSSDAAMLATARAYRFQQIIGDRAPASAVQRTLNLTQPTATLWIRRARERGLLDNDG